MPTPYRGNEPYVFVCYSHADMEDVLAEVGWLQASGVHVWFDEGITPGTEWREELGDAIRNCHLFLYFVTPDAIASPNCRREMNFALEQDRPILAVHLTETELSDGMRLSLNDRQAILRHGESEQSYREKLARSIGQALSAPFQPALDRRPKRSRISQSGALLLALSAAALGALGAWMLKPEVESLPPQVVAFEIQLDAPLAPSLVRVLAISPDGRRIAYTRKRPSTIGPDDLHIRSLDTFGEAVFPKAGHSPHFSPDGRWVALGGAARLPVLGGAPQEIHVSTAGAREFGGTWVDNETIIFADSFGLHLMAVTGGDAETLVSPDTAADEVYYAWPDMLPDGRWVLFTAVSRKGTAVHALDLETRQRRVLLEGATSARYAQTGHLVFTRGVDLQAVAFDSQSLSVQSEPVDLGIQVLHTRNTGANFDLSNNGTLVYLPVPTSSVPFSLVWVDRDGQEEATGAPDHGWLYPRISPDGRFIASDLGGPTRNVHVWDLERGSLLRLTDNPTEDLIPVWSRDGRRIFFASDRNGTFDIFARSADGSNEPTTIFDSARFDAPGSLTPSGDRLLVIQNPQDRADILLLDLENPGSDPQSLIATEHRETTPELSPDGRWLAYQSDVSGQPEVYVRPFPNVERRRWKVSIDGGRFPFWSSMSNEIYYVNPEGDMMAATWSAESEFELAGTLRLFSGEAYDTRTGVRSFDVSPVDGRFLMRKPAKDAHGPNTIAVIVNWAEALNLRVPAPTR